MSHPATLLQRCLPLKSGDVRFWITSPQPHPPSKHVTPPPLIDYFLDFNPVSPHKLKVAKMDARKPKSSKISQKYNYP